MIRVDAAARLADAYGITIDSLAGPARLHGSPACTPDLSASAARQAEPLARLLGAEDAHVHGVEDAHRALDQLAVAGEHAAREVDVVLEADAHVAAGEHGRATNGSCSRPIEKAEKIAPGGSWLTIAISVGMSLGAP